jgi:hypothetical protein
LAEDKVRRERLRQMTHDETRQYFESVTALFPDDEDVLKSFAEGQKLLKEEQATWEMFQNVTDTAIAQNEDMKLDILANRSAFRDNEKAYHRESFEQASFLSGRTFFTTEFGLVGMACQGVSDIKVGDKVVVLKNTKFPMVVREMEDKGYHEIVGYVIIRGFAYEEFEKLKPLEKPLRQAFYFR